jgi:hypothetical protein
VADLIYANLTSLDGHIEDAEGRFDWAARDAEVKVLFSGTLQEARTERTRIEREAPACRSRRAGWVNSNQPRNDSPRALR